MINKQFLGEGVLVAAPPYLTKMQTGKRMTWRNKTSLNQTFFIVIVSTVFIAMALVGYVWISQEYKRFNENSKALKSEYIKDQKLILKAEVERAIDLIRYAKSQTESRLRQDIKIRVYEAYAIAMNIYLENKDNRSEREIIKMIKDALRPIRFNQGRGYFFAGDFNGINQLFTDKPELEGKNLIDMQDTENRFVIKEEIALVKKEKEGFYYYTWTKPNMQGRGFPKISFVKHFEPFNWFIGSGEYIDDVELDIKREVLERVSQIRFEKTGYIFVAQWDGLSLTEPGKGKNMWDVEDENGVKIVQELVKAAKAGGGYVEYVMPKFNGYRCTLKISYTNGIKDWQWYVGAGKFMDEIDATIEQKRIEMNENVKQKITEIVLILLGVLLLIILITRFISQKTRNNFQVFNKFFKMAVSSSDYVDENQLNFFEFIDLAKSANEMIDLRKKAEEALRESEEKYRNVVINAIEAICVIQDDMLKYANPEAVRLYGYTEEELMRLKIDELVYPDDRELVVSRRHQREKGEQLLSSYLHRIITKDGRICWVEIKSIVITWDNRPAILVLLADITNRKRAEEELLDAHNELEQRVDERTEQLQHEIDGRIQVEENLQIAKQEAESANQAKSEFLANISHELRNPMHQILSYSKYGVEKIDKPKEKLLHYFNQTRKSAERLMVLLNDLLDLSKMESGRIDIAFSYNNVHEIVKEAVSELQPAIRNKKLTISIDEHPSISTSIICDYFKVGQVIRNLLANAIEFTPKERRIEIKFRRSNLVSEKNVIPALNVSVSDQGVGIPEDEITMVFDKFTQSSKTKTGAGGTGLGLAICKEIIIAHKGQIWANNNPEDGATFSFLLPYKQDVE